MEPTQIFVDGAWTEPRGDRPPVPVHNPATGAVLASMSQASIDDVDAAVAAAGAALDGPWGQMSGFARRRLLLRFADELRRDADRIAELNTDDVGMPLLFTRGQVDYCADYLEYFAGWADKLDGTAPAMPQTSTLDYTIRRPVGVVAAVVPWNIPVFLTVAKLSAALAAGCPVVLKPSELAPLAPLEIVACAERAGLPAGAVNVVTGLGDVGATLVAHPGVDGVTFTGGTPTGIAVARAGADTMKRLVLELGGKSAQLVLPGADIGAAALGIAQGFLVNTGQQCTAGTRVLVDRSLVDELTERLVSVLELFPVGMPRDPHVLQGPVISADHLDRVLGWIERAPEAGKVVVRGERLGGELADGWFVSPTVVADADLGHELCTTETFGPICTITPVDGPDAAVAAASDTPYGLVAGVWTDDLHLAHHTARRLRVGTVWINTYLGVQPGTPFGGFGASGLGREGGWDAVAGFTEVTNVMAEIRPPAT